MQVVPAKTVRMFVVDVDEFECVSEKVMYSFEVVEVGVNVYVQICVPSVESGKVLSSGIDVAPVEAGIEPSAC
jgi:hypothetical protein